MNEGFLAGATPSGKTQTSASPAGALLAFAPFVAFALIEEVWGPLPGLLAGALASFALLLQERLRGQHEVNILEAGSALLFSGLAALAYTGDPQAWTLWRVRLFVDSGLMLIVLLSIALGRPFTAQHARNRVSLEVAQSARFLHATKVLSAVWALAFAGLVAADALMVLRPQTPASWAIGLTLAALAAAFRFTLAYPARLKASHAAAQEDLAS